MSKPFIPKKFVDSLVSNRIYLEDEVDKKISEENSKPSWEEKISLLEIMSEKETASLWDEFKKSLIIDLVCDEKRYFNALNSVEPWIREQAFYEMGQEKPALAWRLVDKLRHITFSERDERKGFLLGGIAKTNFDSVVSYIVKRWKYADNAEKASLMQGLQIALSMTKPSRMPAGVQSILSESSRKVRSKKVRELSIRANLDAYPLSPKAVFGNLKYSVEHGSLEFIYTLARDIGFCKKMKKNHFWYLIEEASKTREDALIEELSSSLVHYGLKRNIRKSMEWVIKQFVLNPAGSGQKFEWLLTEMGNENSRFCFSNISGLIRNDQLRAEHYIWMPNILLCLGKNNPRELLEFLKKGLEKYTKGYQRSMVLKCLAKVLSESHRCPNITDKEISEIFPVIKEHAEARGLDSDEIIKRAKTHGKKDFVSNEQYYSLLLLGRLQNPDLQMDKKKIDEALEHFQKIKQFLTPSWISEQLGSLSKHPILFCLNNAAVDMKKLQSLKKQLKESDDLDEQVGLLWMIDSMTKGLRYVTYLENLLEHIDFSQNIRRLKNNFRNTDEFASSLCVMEITSHLRKDGIDAIPEPKVKRKNGNETNSDVFVNIDQGFYIEAYTPELWIPLRVKEGAMGVRRDLLKNAVIDKLENQIDQLVVSQTKPIVMAINTQYSHNSEIEVEELFSGSNCIHFSQGQDPRAGLKDDSIYHKSKNANLLSGLIHYSRVDSDHGFSLTGKLYAPPIAKNPLSDTQKKALTKALNLTEVEFK